MPSDTGFAYYMQWMRHIRDTKVKIPAECNRYTLIAFCFTMASYGKYGIGCFAGDTKLASVLGINRRHLAKYRWLAIELGWLRLTGKQRNRVDEVDISIPDYQEDVPTLPDRFTKPRPERVVSEPEKQPKPFFNDVRDDEPTGYPDWYDAKADW